MDTEELTSLDGFHTVHISDHEMLRERRVILGLTQKAVAERASIPLQSYQLFESGKRSIRRASFQIACQVLEALEMDVVSFHHGDYSIGEEIYLQDNELRYVKTGKSISYDPSETDLNGLNPKSK